MAGLNRNWLLPTLLGLAVGLGLLALAVVFSEGLKRLEVAVSDFVFLAENGPQLGRLPATDQIVLVLFDKTSQQQMQALPTYEQDLQLYSKLLAAGARIVADTRMIADGGGEEAADTHQFLEGLVKTGGEGKLYRDIWIASQLPPDFLESVEPFIANNLLNMHPNADSYFEARLYPLAIMLGDRLRESMPLVIAREVTEAARLTSDQVLEQVKACGITSAWQASLGEAIKLRENLRADGVEQTEYPVGKTRVPWHLFPSKSPSILPAGFWISYAWAPTEFTRVSYLEAGDADKLSGKIVLIGYDSVLDPTSDTYRVPSLPHRVSAAELVACAVQTLLEPRLLVPLHPALGSVIVLSLALSAALLGGLLKPVRALLLLALVLGVWFAASVAIYRAGWFVDLVLAPAALVLAGGLGGGYRYLGEIRWRLRIVDLFGRYVPRAVVTQLVQQPDAEALALGGVKREVTVLFADIRGFTPFAERFPPEQVIEQLNSLLQILVDCTFACEGTVDKFIGDAILVLFNAPLDQANHEALAAKAALAMQTKIAEHPSGLAVGIGIHRGEAVVGRVGTPERMEYTAIGSTVNVASRLCSAAERGTIVVSDVVARTLAEQGFHLVEQPPLSVKGVEGPLQTYLLQ
jgi:adenylate cyclase